MNQKIKEALAKLDPTSDEHWTTEGLPRLDVMETLVGTKVSRQDVTSADTTFTRKTAQPLQNIQPPAGQNASNGSQQVQDHGKPEEAQPATPAKPAGAQQDKAEQGGEDNEPTEEQLIEKEYEDARLNLAQAQKRMKKATEAMDSVIIAREKKSAQETQAEVVQKFQASQRKQRELDASKAKILFELQKSVQSVS